MDIFFVVLIGGAAVFYLVRGLKKSIKEGDECAGCGSKGSCNKLQGLDRRKK